jgi:hypothetical protein
MESLREVANLSKERVNIMKFHEHHARKAKLMFVVQLTLFNGLCYYSNESMLACHWKLDLCAERLLVNNQAVTS